MTPPPHPEPLTLVMVEDDPLVAEVNAGYLAGRADCRLLGVAPTVSAARTLLRRQRPDLLLLDIYLPDGNGLDLLTEARAESWVGNVILLTAARDANSVQQALGGGAADFLIKPFTRERLYAALDTVQARRTAMRGGERQFTQGALDRLLHPPRPSFSPELPQRAETQTRRRVQQLLQGQTSALSAEEVGRALGVNRATAWRSLEQLVMAGQVAPELEYGSVGRPTKRYRWKGIGEE